jgi:hypothetical protein
MIKVLAQMKNLRPGHDSQGKLKKVNLDSSYEGYSNFMAPQRMRQIESEVSEVIKDARARGDLKAEEEAKKIFTKDILRPKTDTYLTPEWDEFVPFPTSKSCTIFSFCPSFFCNKYLETNNLSSMESSLRWLWPLRLRRTRLSNVKQQLWNRRL